MAELLSASRTPGENDAHDLIFKSVCEITAWAIWKWRNEILHAAPEEVDKSRLDNLFPGIQRTSALWIGSRSSSFRLNLDSWCSNPVDALCN